MTPFFDTPERVEQLRELVTPWIGTPFVESCGPKAKAGACADCCWLVQPLQRLGAIGRVPWPRRYVSRGGGEEMLAIMIGVLDATERLQCVWKRTSGEAAPELMEGDVLVYSTGKAVHHLALKLGQNTMVHSWDGQVCLGSAWDHRETLLYGVYRAMKP